MSQNKITDNLDALLSLLPPEIAGQALKHGEKNNLLEIILDMGRPPSARFTTGEFQLRDAEVTRADIDFVAEKVGSFDEDNRAGIERTLHRISAIRNRQGDIVGLTCRIGRAVYGTLEIIEDLVSEGKSVLLLGRPGVGKTTLLREAARVLAEKNRVVIVDTSNEIGGGGDVPHPAVGRARRMQVATPSLQHEVMIEAVENHSPEVIVIDEIGRALEAQAARTIAERGVQLVGTAHGNTLDNLLLNPTLSDLVGGIESVTLSDEEARRRGTQKTVLERRSPPTFHILIEIQTRDRLVVHRDVAAAVDALLRGVVIPPEIRVRAADGSIHVEKAPPPPPSVRDPQGLRRQSGSAGGFGPPQRSQRPAPQKTDAYPTGDDDEEDYGDDEDEGEDYPAYQRSSAAQSNLPTIRVYPYGVARNRLGQAARRLRVPIEIVKDPREAEIMVTLQANYRKRQRTIQDAEARGMPLYVLRANTVRQMERFLSELFNLSTTPIDNDDENQVLSATRSAIEAVLNGERWVELPPASSYIRRLQHQLARESQLVSHSYGKDPYRRVRIFREPVR